MTRFKEHLLVLAGLGVLAVAGTLMDSSRNSAHAASPPPVLKGPPPEQVAVVSAPPVTGTVGATESGLWSVAATQSGAWNVGINGTVGVTGNVSITGQPLSVNANITNTSLPVQFSSSSPLLFKNVEEPGRVPYQEEQQGFVIPASDCNVQVCGLTMTFATVPAGERLVIKNVSATLNMNTGGTFLSAFLSGYLGGLQQIALPSTVQYFNKNVGTDYWVIQQQVDLYVDAGQAPTVAYGMDGTHGTSAQGSATLTGYFVTLP